MVDLIVPVKRLSRAKSRLRGAVSAEHTELVLALLHDTVTAARAAEGVGRIVVVCEDERVPAALRGIDVECVDERGLPGLNEALGFGADLVLADDPSARVGALQADLPALRPAELAEALAEQGRVFCADRVGTGTTLLVAAPGTPLDPRFGPGSAVAHAESGARQVGVLAASLRADVDTAEDLAVASKIGLGRRTSALQYAFLT